MRWLITGASGLLGEFVRRQIPSDHEQVGWYFSNPPSHIDGRAVERVDVRDGDAVNSAMSGGFDVCIHTAANANVDSCEANPATTRELNVVGTQNIVDACRRHGTHLIHVSTDYVFDDGSAPYSEDDERNPLQVYGKTKLEAEDVVASLPRALIARIPMLYGRATPAGKATWLEGVVEQFERGEPFTVDDSAVRQPAFSDDVAHILMELGLRNDSGVVHVAPRETMTRHRWAQLVAKLEGYDEGLISRADASSGGVPRPQRATLAIEKLVSMGIAPPRNASEVLPTLL